MCAPNPTKVTDNGHQQNAVVLGTGAEFGNHYTTEQMLDALIEKQSGNPDFDIEFARRVFEKCGFDKHSVALDYPDLFRRFSRSEYLAHRATNLVGLAAMAGQKALENWNGPRSKITHLFWGTMTGALHSPTIDIELVKRLGLDPDVERTSIEGMGCLTGFRLLNLAAQVAKGNPDARILVVSADLRSAIGNSLPSSPTRADIVSIALFRDAASAAVVGSSSVLRPEEQPVYEIIAGASRIVEGTSHLVKYYEEDDGAIRLLLDRKLPDYVGLAEPSFVASLLEKGRRSFGKAIPSDMAQFDVLCHTGGPRVLSEVATSLGVSSENMKSSWNVMKQNGNLSGASNLAVLDHHNCMANADPSSSSEWAVCLSMGPGVCLEGILLHNLRHSRSAVPPPKASVPKAAMSLYKTPNENIEPKTNTRKVIHIVGGGISGMALAAALDPEQFTVRVFEASDEVREQGYGMAIWPSTMSILRDRLGVSGLDLFQSDSMVVRTVQKQVNVKVGQNLPDKGFMQRSHLLERIKARVEELHPGCISTGHKCFQVRFQDSSATASYLSSNTEHPVVSYTCDLLVGADGVNSTVRQYVALKKDCREHGHMTAYRFVVANPSPELLKNTATKWNMSVAGMFAQEHDSF